MNAPLAYPPVLQPGAQSAPAADLPARLMDLLDRALAQGRAGAARPLLAALRCLVADTADMIERHARLLLLEGRSDAALALLGQHLDADGPARLLLCRGEVLVRSHEFAAAAADLAGAVLAGAALAPAARVAAKAWLGVALLNLGQAGDAVLCLNEAVALEPANPLYRQALAQGLERQGSKDAAAAVLDAGIALCPGHTGLRIAAIMLRMQSREHAAAAALAEQAQRDGVADACILGLLGHARSSLGLHEAAAEAYAAARTLAPEDPYVRHLAAAAGLSADAGRASAEYVEVVFDGYASRFDGHLIGLGYRVPGLLRAELAGWTGPAGPVLDLGCGTGLVAVALLGLPLGPLAGVDLSQAMLAQAGARGLYGELHHADLLDFLAAETRRFPLMLAADVLPYFGDLTPVLQAASARLAPGGVLLGSVEAAGPGGAGWRLGRLGRYQHSEAHLRAAAAASGLRLTLLRPETLRLEAQAPVSGLLIGLQKGAA